MNKITPHEINQDVDFLKRMLAPHLGGIIPYGETRTDEKRYNNLLVQNELVWELLYEIMDLVKYKDRNEHSVKRQGEEAYKFIESIYKELRDIVEDENNG